MTSRSRTRRSVLTTVARVTTVACGVGNASAAPGPNAKGHQACTAARTAAIRPSRLKRSR